jgi:hypothetical protein
MSEVIELTRDEVLVPGEGGTVITLADAAPELIELALQGPPGPPGPPGAAGAQTLTLTAAADLSGHRMVVATAAGALYADPGTPAHADMLVGLTTGAALTGTPADILAAGELTEPSWSWTPGLPLYVVAGGLLSHTPPASGWVQMVAQALSSTRILLGIRQSIFLT